MCGEAVLAHAESLTQSPALVGSSDAVEERMLRETVVGVLNGPEDERVVWQRLAELGVIELAWLKTCAPSLRRCVGIEVGRSGRTLPWAATAVAGEALADSKDGSDVALLSDLASARGTACLVSNGVAVAKEGRDPKIFALVHGAPAMLAGSAVLVDEAAGAMQRLVELTRDYVAMRTQFGRALSNFQAVQHRLADMALAAGQALALSFAATSIADAATIHAARLKCAAAGRLVWQGAMQLHGAIGTTAEAPIKPFVMRLIAIERSLGDAQWHSERYAAVSASPSSFGILGPSFDTAWRAEVQTFLDGAVVPELREAGRRTVGFFSDPDAGRQWHYLLNERGWAAPGWPVDRGGSGWSPERRYIFDLESRRANAPHSNPMGLRMVGPVLMRFGTAAQQDRFVPMILAGQQLWCQGFSEPNAGSDLASLATRAIRDGDDYVINGSKIWTTHAQHADWMFGLFRTASEGRKQDGISFLVLDMRSPGVSVRPINGIDGERDLNQVFFDEVRVPADQIIGPEGGGWMIAKSLLELERGGGLAGPELRVRHERIGCPDDPVLQRRWAEVGADVAALEMMELAMFVGLDLGIPEGALPSMLKLQAAAARQALSQLAIDRCDGDDAAVEYATRVMLADRAHSIFGGATEIQKGIIARAIERPS